MKPVSDTLLETIREIQALPSLQYFTLGGGTNLALRYHHRSSIDIDLFSDKIHGSAGFEIIVSELSKRYGGQLSGLHFPCKESEQYMFLRLFIHKNGHVIKVDVLQNFKRVENPEIIDGIRLLTVKDVGLLKLMSIANRGSHKDAYDLDYITEEVPLPNLLQELQVKEKLFNTERNKTIFDLDNQASPTKDPLLLLKFEESKPSDKRRPGHSHDRLDIMEGQKNWNQARSSLRRKIRGYFNEIGVEFPSASGI